MLGIAQHVRQSRRQPRLRRRSGIFVQAKYFAHQRVQIKLGNHRRRSARIVTKFIDHALHRADLIDDGIGAAGEQISVGATQFIPQLHLQALGRQLDRRQRVFDFVRQAPRHFTPGSRALRRHQSRNVIADDQVSRLSANIQARAAHQQTALHRFTIHCTGPGELDLPLPGLAAVTCKCFHHFRREGRQPWQAGECLPLCFLGIKAENRLGALIGSRQFHSGIQHQHSGGETGENVFDISLGRFELRLLLPDIGARIIELACHARKRLGQYAEFIRAGDFVNRRKVALCHCLGALGQQGQWRRQPAGKVKRSGNRGEQGEQQCERQRHGVDVAQALARQRQFRIVAIAGLDIFRARGELLRHRLQYLQHARLDAEGTRGNRGDDTHAQSGFFLRLDTFTAF